ncbi:hypothetical protein C0991_005095 [Blastosporella zonata]|nr:hypothetical protein C0991_005095 [Blastosporella zonata]
MVAVGLEVTVVDVEEETVDNDIVDEEVVKDDVPVDATVEVASNTAVLVDPWFTKTMAEPVAVKIVYVSATIVDFAAEELEAKVDVVETFEKPSCF